MEGSSFYYCPRCTFFDPKMTLVVSHLGLVHGGEQNFSVTCAIDSCGKSYRNVQSYRKHLYKRHKDVISLSEPPQSPMECEATLQDDPFPQEESHDEPPSISKHQTFQEFLATITETVCMFFFKLTEEHKVPHSAADTLFSDMKFMLQALLDRFAEQVKQALPFSLDPLPRDLASLLDCSFVDQIFSCVKSKHARQQFAKNAFPFASSEEMALGDDGDTFQ